MRTKIQPCRGGLFALCLAALFCLLCAAQPAPAASSIGENIETAANGAKASVEQTTTAAADKVSEMWKRIDEKRLVNRTPDEIVAWVIMGVLVGALAGLFSIMRTSVVQRFWALGLGLIGSFIGGIVAHVAGLDFGMGPVMIRYEDLLLALVGGLLLIVVVRFVAARRKGQV